MSYRSIAVLLVLAAAFNKAKPGAPGRPGGGMPPMPVEVSVAQRDTVVDAIAATGQIEAIQAIDLRPEVEGRIVDILVREGQEVEKGTPLFKVDDAELRAQVARAAADRDLARQALERTKQLVAQNASSAADLERAEATASGADAQLDLLQVRLDRSVVRAPFGGVVGRRYVSLGDYVNSSTKLTAVRGARRARAVRRPVEAWPARELPGRRPAGTQFFR